MGGKVGIKESLEVVAGLELVGVNVAAASVDGFDISDVKFALNIVKDSDKLVEAVKGFDQIDEEIKDLEQEELLQLGVAAFAMIKKIAAARKAQA